MKRRKKTPVIRNETAVAGSIFTCPFYDFTFKRIFASGETKLLSINFLNSLLFGERIINDIDLAPTERSGLTGDVRKVIFDAEGESDDNVFFIMEMQNAPQSFIKSRNIYYAAANLHEQLGPGNQDFKLKELIFICLTNFIYDPDNPEDVVQTIKFTVQENKQIFYNQLTFKYIELPKFKKQEHELVTRFDKWLYALTTMEKATHIPLSLQGDEIFEKLYEVSRLSNLNKKEMKAYQRAQMDRMDYFRGLNVAKMEGRLEGKMEGKIEEQYAIAKALKEKKIAVSIISESTGLSEQEIECL